MSTILQSSNRRVRMATIVFCMMIGGCDRPAESPHDAITEQPHAASSPLAENIEKALAAAQSYLDSQDVTKAQAILLTLIERAPQNAHAHELLGQSYAIAALQAHNRRDADGAVEWRRQAYEQYKIAAALDPTSAGLHHSAGQIALLAGRADDALEHFRTASRLDDTRPQYPLYAAQLLIQRRQFAEAQTALQRVLAIDPDEATAHASLAMIAMEQQQFDLAQQHIGDARRIQPGDLGLRAQEARVHRRRGNPKRGLELLIGLSPAERAHELIAFEIAACYDQMDQPMNAARAWQHVHQNQPMAPKAWLAAVRTGEFLLKAGEREQAALWLGQAQMAAPDAPEVKSLQDAIAAAAD